MNSKDNIAVSRVWVAAFGYLLNSVLVLTLAGGIAFLVYLVARRPQVSQWQTLAAEVMLFVVLAAEGLFAILHLRESQADKQAQSLRDFMHDSSSEEALEEREELFTGLPWGCEFGHIPEFELEWGSEGQDKSVIYKAKGNDSLKIEVTMQSAVWRSVQRLCDQYHFAGLSCRRGYMATQDVLNWMGPQLLRWWRRLGHIIRQERERRKNPWLFEGFEWLANESEAHLRRKLGIDERELRPTADSDEGGR